MELREDWPGSKAGLGDMKMQWKELAEVWERQTEGGQEEESA
jgi:hypothetical protein